MDSPLLHLPAELIENIAAATDSPGLLALRSTCRELCRGVDNVYVERFFTNRRHLVTNASFRTLVCISKNPRLRRKLATIDLVVTNLSPAITTSAPAHGRKAAASASAAAEQHHSRSIWSRWDPEATDTRDRSDVSMLAEALSHLKDAGIIPELKVSTYSHFSPTSYGFGQLVRQLSSTYKTNIKSEYLLLGRSPDDGGETASLLLSAVAKAQFPVRALYLSEKKAPLSHNSLARVAGDMSMLRSSLSQLQSLAVSVGCVHKLDTHDVAMFQEISRSAPSLQSFRLEFNSECCGVQKVFLPSGILEAFTFEALKAIQLTGAVVRQRDLCDFLGRHKRSLRALTLRHVSIGPGEKFAAIFDWMKENLALDSLFLHWIQQGYDHMDEANGRGAEYVFAGAMEVNVGLEKLSRCITFGEPSSSAYRAPEQKQPV